MYNRMGYRGYDGFRGYHHHRGGFGFFLMPFIGLFLLFALFKFFWPLLLIGFVGALIFKASRGWSGHRQWGEGMHGWNRGDWNAHHENHFGLGEHQWGPLGWDEKRKNEGDTDEKPKRDDRYTRRVNGEDIEIV